MKGGAMRHLNVVLFVLVLFMVGWPTAAEAQLSCSRIVTGSPTEYSVASGWLRIGVADSFGNYQWCRAPEKTVAPTYTTYEKMVAVSWATSPELPKTDLPTKDPRSARATSVLMWESRPREKRWSKTGTIYGGWLLGTTAGDVYRTFGAMDAGATEGSLLFAGESKGAVLAGELLISAVVWEGSRFLRNTSCGRAGVFPKIGCFLGHALPISAGGFRIAAAKHNHNMEKRLRE